MPAFPLQTVSLVDAVAESLRRAIIDSQYEAGAALTEIRVSEDFGVARSTAKAAVERLVTAGFLERAPHRSARVPRLSAADVDDLYETRRIIESAAVRRAASSASLHAAITDAEAELLRAALVGDRDAVASADVAFHTALVQAAGLQALSSLHSLLMGRAHIAMVQVQRRNPSGALRSHAEHEAILESIREGDAEAAAHRLDDHLRRAQQDFARGE